MKYKKCALCTNDAGKGVICAQCANEIGKGGK